MSMFNRLARMFARLDWPAGEYTRLTAAEDALCEIQVNGGIITIATDKPLTLERKHALKAAFNAVDRGYTISGESPPHVGEFDIPGTTGTPIDLSPPPSAHVPGRGERPALSVVPRHVDGAGLSNLAEWERKLIDPHYAELAERLDLEQQENEALYRENMLLRSEVNALRARLSHDQRPAP